MRLGKALAVGVAEESALEESVTAEETDSHLQSHDDRPDPNSETPEVRRQETVAGPPQR